MGLGLTGCGGDSSVDARCKTLCTIKEPSISGAYDICSQASADSCLADCAAHISGVSTLCASCLLEDSCFNVSCGDSANDPVFCSSGQCTITGRAGSCNYPEGNKSAYENCVRQVEPRREVQCQPAYQAITKCGTACSGS